MPSVVELINGVFIFVAGLAHALPQPNPVAAYPPSESNWVNFRIEGDANTIYEAPIYSGPRDITTASGGTHPCDGTNFNANPTAGNTCTDALDAASEFWKLPYDGTYDAEFDDFFITSISTSAQTGPKLWGLLLNYQFTPVGGCQQEVKTIDQVLWAYNAFVRDSMWT